MRTFSEKHGRENQNTHFMHNNFFFFLNRAVYEIMLKNITEPKGVTDDNMAHSQFTLGA